MLDRAIPYGQADVLLRALEGLAEQPLSDTVVLLQIARTLRSLRNGLGEFYEARDGLVRRFTDDGRIGPDHPRWVEFATEYNKLAATPCEVSLSPVGIQDLEGVQMTASALRHLIDAEIVLVPDDTSSLGSGQ